MSPSPSSNTTCKRMKPSPMECLNFINGEYTKSINPASKPLPILSPSTNEEIGTVVLSEEKDVESAVQAAMKALDGWKNRTVKSRAAIMFKFHSLMQQHAGKLSLS